MIKIEEITKKEEWESFSLQAQNPSLLQSWAWREFNKAAGRKVWVFLAKKQDAPQAGVLVVKMDLPLGKYYLYSPRGPLFATGLTKEQKEEALKSLRQYCEEHPLLGKALFWRIDPEFSIKELDPEKVAFLKADKEIQPRDTVKLDLSLSEEELLAEMKSKTRYNIRLAGKKAVIVKKGEGKEDLHRFYKLLKNTAKRQDFNIHPQHHYESLWKELYPDNLNIYLAYYKDQVVAGTMMGNYGQTALYLHGASDTKHRSLMAPYLLHWQAIKETQKSGLRYYDFWGVAPQKAGRDHAWAGISRFKTGFGGQYYQYFGSYDYVFDKKWYYFFNKARQWRKLLK